MASESQPSNSSSATGDGERQDTSFTSAGTCPVCLDDCSDPRVLACLHSACRGCIDRMAVTAGQAREVKCPVCRASCPISKQGASALPKNPIAPDTRRVECDVCGTTEAKGWCSTCEVFVCSNHLAEHMTSTPKNAKDTHRVGHFFMMFDSPEKASAEIGIGKFKEAVTLCSSHGQPLLYFCQKCDVPVCGDCGLLGSHVGHGVTKAASIVAEQRAKVSDGVIKLHRDVEPHLVRSLEKVDDTTSQLGANADGARDKIEAATLRAIEAVKLSAVRLRQEVEDEEQSRTKVLDEQRDGLKHQLEAARGAASFGEEVVQQVDDDSGESLPLLVAVEERVAAICQDDVESEPKHHSNLDFQAPDTEVLAKKALELVGDVLLYNASSSHSSIRGEVLKTATVEEAVEVVVIAKTKQNVSVKNLKGGTITTRWLSRADQSSEDIPVEVSETDTPGEYKLTTRPTVCGEYTLEVSINRIAMPQPVTITIVPPGMSFDPNDRDQTITLSEDRRKATKTSGGGGHVSVLGLQGMRHGRHSWKIKIGSASYWHCVGVAVKPRSNGYDSGYAWSSHAQRYKSTHDSRPMTRWQGSDCLQFHLNCDNHTLEMISLRSGESHTITSLPDTEVFVYANFYGQGGSVAFE